MNMKLKLIHALEDFLVHVYSNKYHGAQKLNNVCKNILKLFENQAKLLAKMNDSINYDLSLRKLSNLYITYTETYVVCRVFFCGHLIFVWSILYLDRHYLFIQPEFLPFRRLS